MTQQPFPPSALRGAVDLSALKRPAPGRGQPGVAGAPTAPGAPGADAGGEGLLVTGSDATFQDIVNRSVRHP
ncbi:MAG TPA: co-chaperone YbbN, partial [Nocardioidaceae bacterium]|nr:co-chaperone YbbN [Nocardioidaceae bacterium]